MESVNAQLRLMKIKFPEQVDRIEALFESDEDFRSLCLDYYMCLQYLEKFNQEFNEKHKTIAEYKTIRTELEKELHETIFGK